MATTLTACDDADSSPADGINPPAVAFDQPSEKLSLTEDSYLLTTTSDSLYRISALDGNIEFLGSANVPGVELLGPVDVVNGSVIISATDNTLVSVDLETGANNWGLNLGPMEGLIGSPSAPACSSTVCYVVGDSKDLFAINASDGSLVWSVSLNVPDVASPAVDSRALFASDERIFIGVGFGTEQRLNVYSRNSGGLLVSIEIDGRVSGVPAMLGNYLFVSTLNDLYAYDLTSYELIWRAELGAVTVPVVVADTVVVIASAEVFNSTDAGQVVVGIDIQSGAVKWVTSNGGPTFYDLTTDGRLAFVLFPTSLGLAGTDGGFPRAINPIDGSIVWERILGGGRALVEEEPLVVPGYLFFNDYLENEVGFGFAALDSNTGGVLWVSDGAENTEIRRESRTSVLVHDGQVYRNNSFPTLSK